MSRKHRPYGKGYKLEEYGKEKGDMIRIRAHAVRGAMKHELDDLVVEAYEEENEMEDLIKALQILMKYCDPTEYAPTHCEHDILMIVCVDVDDVSEEDIAALDDLGFHIDDQYDRCFASYRFGSA